MKKIYLLLIIVISMSLNLGCKKDKEYSDYNMDMYAMGSYINVTIYSQTTVDNQIFDSIKNTIVNIDNNISINNEEIISEIDKINKNAGKKYVSVSKDTFELIEESIKYAKETNRHNDISIGAVVKLWNIGFENASVPNDKDIDGALKLCNIDDIELDYKSNSVKLRKQGMIIDLGSIAKGYVGEKVKSIILDAGYEKALLNIGGNIVCVGTKSDNLPYKVAIRDGNKGNNDYLGILEVENKSVVSSGIYERNFKQNGKLYHHILDTNTGYPVENELLGVSVISDNSTYCDALSTALLSMGTKEGMKFVESRDNLEAIFITKDNKIYLSKGIRNKFKLTSQDYKLT